MTDKGKKTLVGIFVLGAIGILLAFIVLVASGQFFNPTYRFVCYFSSSLRGLVVGSPVNLHGVRIGKVVSVQVVSSPSEVSYSIPVVIDMDKDSLFGHEKFAFFDQEDADKIVAAYVNQGLRAQLGIQSLLTGQLSVDLNYVSTPESPVDTFALPRYEGFMQIPSVPTQLDAVWDTMSKIPFEELANQALSAIKAMETALNEVSIIIKDSNLDQLSNTYISLGKTIDETVQGFATTQTAVNKLLASVSSTSDTANVLMKENSPKVADLLSTAQNLTHNADNLISQISSSIQEDSVMMLEISQTLQALQSASAAIGQLANMLQVNPEALIFGK